MSRRKVWLAFAGVGLSGVLCAMAQATPIPVDVVATEYHAPTGWTNPPGPIDRALSFTNLTDGNVDTGVDTYCYAGQSPHYGWGPYPSSHWAGLIYNAQGTFETVSLTLGNQFFDGGTFASAPNLYVWKTSADPDRTNPLTSSDYSLLGVASTGAYSAKGDTITFDLSGIAPADRTGYGFAVCGAAGGSAQFISVGDISATFAIPEPSNLVLLGYALAGLLAYAWRKQK